MKWLKKSIKNLELHRKEILETRRASRINKLDESLSRSVDSSICGNLNNTETIRDIKDILGPLPELPDSNINWSRRISGFSGIYEEILDGEPPNRNNERKSSRASTSSGIYEVMRPPLEVITETVLHTPPPLPPRTRTSTQGEIHRCYTNPETELYKKRSCNIFDSVFWRHKRSDSCGSDSKPKMNTKGLPKTSDANKILEFDVIKDKRSSFSSPDLTRINHYSNHDPNIDEISDSSMLCNISMMSSELNTSELMCSPPTNSKDLNISENILSTYNISCNMSTVNLVGSKLNGKEMPKKTQFIDDVSGYCRMAPVFHTPVILEDVVKNLPVINSVEYFTNRDLETELPEDSRLDISPSITFRRNYNVDEKDFRENIRSLSITNNMHNMSINNDTSNRYVSFESMKNNLEIEENISNISKETNILTEPPKENIFLYKSPYTGTVIDEKYPSYYPNIQKSNGKGSKKRKKHLSNVNVTRTENVYISLPSKKNQNDKSSEPINYSQVQIINNERSEIISSELLIPSQNISITIDSPTLQRYASESTDDQATPRLYQRYATLARVTPNRYTEKVAKKSDIGTSIKRFASLPRFRKIDFSPLKIKINSVLQRHNSDNF